MPLDAVDLQHVSLLYTQGEMAAVAPIYDYNFKMLTETLTEASWRQLLFWLGPPGIVIGALALFTLREPRTAKPPAPRKPLLRLPFMSGVPPEPTPSGLQLPPASPPLPPPRLFSSPSAHLLCVPSSGVGACSRVKDWLITQP